MYKFPITLTIAAGAALSNAVAVDALVPVGIFMPAAWTAAAITFNVSADGVNWEPLFDQTGAEVSVAVAAAHATIINPADYDGFPFIQLRSGTSASPVNQTLAASIQVIFRPSD